MRSQLTLAFSALLLPAALRAQAPYEAPNDPLVQQKLARWQDLKFGLLMHWGPYSQWGVVESWSLCPEDEDWCRRDSIHGATWTDYVQNYEALQKSFDPQAFDPAPWAAAAKAAGMRYMVFTTKHHDGFCMYDTRTTDYRITSPNTPFNEHPKADVARSIFDAFRKEGLWTGAYFSKPDWHSDDYWWRYFPPKDRNSSYDPKKHPARWKAFQDFSYTQIEELMSGYGNVDILWLDGGWVRPLSSVDTSIHWQRDIRHEQDIDMPRIAAMARAKQPGILVVDRTVGGAYENYITPEGHVPDSGLGVPWETCMPMATSWSHVPGDRYKSTTELLRTLAQTTARGGSLLLNIAPDAQGRWDADAFARLRDIGTWMDVHAAAIHDTRAANWGEGPEHYCTHSTRGDTTYAIIFPQADGKWPQRITLRTGNVSRNMVVDQLGSGTRLKWEQQSGETRVDLRKLRTHGLPAVVLRFVGAGK